MIYFPMIGGLPGVILDGSMHAIAKRLNALDGVESEVFPWFRWKEARRRCVDAHKAGKTIAGGGHSYGCLEWHKISIDLAKLNIPIAYIGSIDPTASPVGYGAMPIAGNVEFVDEFWASLGWPAFARLRSGSGARGGMHVYPYGTKHKIHKFMSGHIALASKEAVQARIVEKARELAG
jgi:hypothetical protein